MSDITSEQSKRHFQEKLDQFEKSRKQLEHEKSETKKRSIFYEIIPGDAYRGRSPW